MQGVFVQDFPFLPTGSPDDTTGFGKDLRDYLQKLSRCRHHIWGQTAPLVSISSQSSHQRSGLLCPDGFENGVAGNSGSRCGHPRLQEAITELKRVDFSAAQGERWFSGLRLLFIDGRSSRSLAALALVVSAILIPSVPGKHTGQDFNRYGRSWAGAKAERSVPVLRAVCGTAGHLKLRRILTEERVGEAFNPSTAGEVSHPGMHETRRGARGVGGADGLIGLLCWLCRATVVL